MVGGRSSHVVPVALIVAMNTMEGGVKVNTSPSWSPLSSVAWWVSGVLGWIGSVGVLATSPSDERFPWWLTFLIAGAICIPAFIVLENRRRKNGAPVLPTKRAPIAGDEERDNP